MFRYYFRGQPSETSRTSNDSSVYQCCSLTPCQKCVSVVPADWVGNDVVRIVPRPFLPTGHTKTEMSHNLPIPRTESRSWASQECCSITKITRQSKSQRVRHLHVARTSTNFRAGRFPRAVVFFFDKIVLTHISCRDDALVNTKLLL